MATENSEFFVLHSHITPSLGVNPCKFRFNTVPACDRRTDNPTVANIGLCIASYADAM